jgi:hypothetical protein
MGMHCWPEILTLSEKLENRSYSVQARAEKISNTCSNFENSEIIEKKSKTSLNNVKIRQPKNLHTIFFKL